MKLVRATAKNKALLGRLRSEFTEREAQEINVTSPIRVFIPLMLASPST